VKFASSCFLLYLAEKPSEFANYSKADIGSNQHGRPQKQLPNYPKEGENPHAVTSVSPGTFHKVGLLLLFLLSVPTLGIAQESALTYPRNLAELSTQAANIVHGHIVSARVEPHPQLTNLSTVLVTLQVQEVLKGQASATFTFRQFIWSLRDRYDGGGYRKGQELLLLMNAPSQYGLSSPAGMEQGRFLIQRDKLGNQTAINGHSNAGLFRNLPEFATRRNIRFSPTVTRIMARHKQGPVPLQALEEVIKQMAGAK
jgi:hypothetical protein